ncbi:MAG: nucleotidyltransferase family protein [Anaerolineae bacterium]|nr:nucleotidyltransferase family protein [Anaerolineae bacterium]
MTQSTDPFTLLALCARACGHLQVYERLRQYAPPSVGRVSIRADDGGWDNLLALAEQHGLSPLLLAHLQAAGIDLDPQVRQQLQARALQHAHANRVRAAVLSEALAALHAAGIPVLILKGAALAHLVYPGPGLRAMRDIDLLAPDAPRARDILLDMGFEPPAYSLPPDHPHLPAVKKWVDGQQVTIEVHYKLFAPEARLGVTTYDDLAAAAQPFDLGGVTAYTLGKEDMLWHVYAHAFQTPLTYEPFRLIWIADLVSLVEAWIDAIDWDAVQRRDRRAFNALPMLHHLTPWSERVLERLAMDVRRVPADVGQTFAGWPRFSLAAQKDKGLAGTLRDTFCPPEWWLRVRYGVGGPVSWLWYRCAGHPLHIILREMPPSISIHAAHHIRLAWNAISGRQLPLC